VLEAEGIKIDKRAIELTSPIREIGVFQVPVKLHPEVSVDVKVWVVKE
jgi:large subunit ribosomal protein L9